MFSKHLAAGAAAATLVLTGLSSTIAPPAFAVPPDPRCKAHKGQELDTPLADTDLNNVEVCIGEADDPPSGKYQATVLGFWTDGGGRVIDGIGKPVRKFDKFHVSVRIEQDGRNQEVRTCNLTREINAADTGSLQCSVEGVPVGGGPVTADAVITYNIQSDGAGDRSWQLHGSPGIP
jgi:hypothetical protein